LVINSKAPDHHLQIKFDENVLMFYLQYFKTIVAQLEAIKSFELSRKYLSHQRSINHYNLATGLQNAQSMRFSRRKAIMS